MRIFTNLRIIHARLSYRENKLRSDFIALRISFKRDIKIQLKIQTEREETSRVRSRYRNGIRSRCSVVSVRTSERNGPSFPQMRARGSNEEGNCPDLPVKQCSALYLGKTDRGDRAGWFLWSFARISNESSALSFSLALPTREQGQVHARQMRFSWSGNALFVPSRRECSRFSLMRILCVNWFLFVDPWYSQNRNEKRERT